MQDKFNTINLQHGEQLEATSRFPSRDKRNIFGGKNCETRDIRFCHAQKYANYIRLSPFVVTHIIPSVNRSECIPALRFSPRVFRPYARLMRARYFFRVSFVPPLTTVSGKNRRWKVKISVNAHVAHVSLQTVCVLRNARSRSISVTEILAHLSTSVKGHVQTRNLNHLFYSDISRILRRI